MLNYLGDSIGGGMPAAVPGGILEGGPQPAQPAPGPLPGMLPPEMTGQPANEQYVAVTQEDNTVLLHIKRPDGSLGPVVKIVQAIKPKKQG